MTIHPAAMLNSLRSLFPAGRQSIEIIDARYDANSEGTGMLLEFQAQVVGGEYDGRPLVLQMALEHDDAEAQQIGQRHFAALRRAISAPNPETTDELRFKPFDVQIGVAKGRNVIRAYGEWGA